MTHETPIRDALRAYGGSVKKTWRHDRRKTVGASEVGQCLRRQAFSKLDAERDPDAPQAWGATLRGELIEAAYFVPALRARYKHRLRFAGKYQETFINPPLSATPDGIVLEVGRRYDEGGSFLVECKSIDPRTEHRDLKAEHEFQAQVQLGLVRHCTDFRPRDCHVTVIDAAWLDTVDEYVVRFDPDIFAEAINRAYTVMECRNPADLPAEGVRAGGKECTYCPYTRACGQVRADRVPKHDGVLSEVVARRIEGVAVQAKALRTRANSLEVAAKGLEEQVRAEMHQAGTRSLDTEVVQVRWSQVKGRTSLDVDKLEPAIRAAGLNLSAFQRSGASSDRLTIKILGNGAEALPETEN